MTSITLVLSSEISIRLIKGSPAPYFLATSLTSLESADTENFIKNFARQSFFNNVSYYCLTIKMPNILLGTFRTTAGRYNSNVFHFFLKSLILSGNHLQFYGQRELYLRLSTCSCQKRKK